MLKFKRIFVLLLLSVVCGVNAKGFLPSALQRCHLFDDDCYTAQAQNYFQHYKYGIPEHNVPGIEPLEIADITAQIGDENSSMQLNLLLTNTSIHHFGNSTVNSLKFEARPTDLSKPMKSVMTITAPLLDVMANYRLKGKFLVLPINSKGKVSVKMNQVVMVITNQLQAEKRADGRTYFRVVSAIMTVEIGSGHFDMTNLFDDPAISESTLKVFNDEWKAFEKELGPKINEASQRSTTRILQKLFDLIPIDDASLNK